MTLTIYADTGYASGAVNPAAPFPVLAQFENARLVLSWAPVEGAIGYSVYAGVRDDSMVPIELNLSATTCTISALDQPGYAVKVIADLGGGSSAASYLVRTNGASIQTVGVITGEGTVELDFSPVFGAIGYNVYMGRLTDEESPQPLPQRPIPGGPWAQSTATGFLIQGLTNDINYFFQIQPVFKDWLGPCTIEVNAMPGNTIPAWAGENFQVGAIASQVVGNPIDTRVVPIGGVAANTRVSMRIRARINGNAGQKFLKIVCLADPSQAMLFTIPQGFPSGAPGSTNVVEFTYEVLVNGGTVNQAYNRAVLDTEDRYNPGASPAYSTGASQVAGNLITLGFSLQAQAWVAANGDSINVDEVSATPFLPFTGA